VDTGMLVRSLIWLKVQPLRARKDLSKLPSVG
jgi:hypothetical protein